MTPLHMAVYEVRDFPCISVAVYKQIQQQPVHFIFVRSLIKIA